MLSGDFVTASRTARWWFTDRDGGESNPPYASRNLAAHVGDDASAVRRNRDVLQTEISLGVLTWMGPVHGVDIEVIDDAIALVPDVDALATSRTARPLVTLAADCVPLLMVAGDLAIAAHIGWRGFADGMTASILALLRHRGVEPTEARIVLGPAICGSCYGIPAERAAAISAVSKRAIVPARDGGPGADIRVGLVEQWEAVGASIEMVGPCTFEDQHFFSHRRDGVTGRQAGVIAWI